MKIGIFSDIHGNLRALEAILDSFWNQGIKNLICMGDIVGYYHQSLEVLDSIMKLNIQSILGNHDAYLLGKLKCSSEKWRVYFLEQVKESISKEQLEWLSELPEFLEINLNGKKLAFFHGSPWDHLEEYIYPDSNKFESFKTLNWDIIFLGHTHYPMVKEVGSVKIVNPGSCGQPRDGDLRASAVIYDSKKEQVFFIRENYNTQLTVEEARSAGVDPEVIKKLR